MTEYLIATSVLEAIVRGSLESDDRLRFHSAPPLVRSHPVEVVVEKGTCHVSVQLDARMGVHLPTLTAEVRQKVVEALGPMTGLAISAVDVVFGGVFPSGA